VNQEGRLPVDGLEREARVLFRYLASAEPSPYLSSKYRDAHTCGAVATRSGRFDPLTLKIALLHPAAVAIADAYCALFARSSILRVKLVLVAALLDSQHPTSSLVDAAGPGTARRFLGLAAARAAIFLGKLVPGTLVLGPLHALCWALDAFSSGDTA